MRIENGMAHLLDGSERCQSHVQLQETVLILMFSGLYRTDQHSIAHIVVWKTWRPLRLLNTAMKNTRIPMLKLYVFSKAILVGIYAGNRGWIFQSSSHNKTPPLRNLCLELCHVYVPEWRPRQPCFAEAWYDWYLRHINKLGRCLWKAHSVAGSLHNHYSCRCACSWSPQEGQTIQHLLWHHDIIFTIHLLTPCTIAVATPAIWTCRCNHCNRHFSGGRSHWGSIHPC